MEYIIMYTIISWAKKLFISVHFPLSFCRVNDFIQSVLYLQKGLYTETTCFSHRFTNRSWTVVTGQKSRLRKQFSRQKSNRCCLNFRLTHVLMFFAYLKLLSVLLWKTLCLSGPTTLFWNKFILVLEWVLGKILNRDRRRQGPSSPEH